MSGLLRIVTFVIFALWSLTLWGAYAIVSFGGDLLYRSADRFSGDPETVEWTAWLLNLTQDVGLVAIAIVWGLGALTILVLGLGFARLFARREPVRYEPVRRDMRPRTSEPEILPPEPAGPLRTDDAPRTPLPRP